MAQRHRASHGSLFLMELIFSILLFTIIATICISGFVKSHTLSRDAALQSHYITMASNVAEVLRSTDGWNDTAEALSSYYPDAMVVNTDTGEETPLKELSRPGLPTTCYIYYNNDFQPCKAEDAAYCAQLDLAVENQFLTAEIGIRVGGNTAHVYDITIEHFYHATSGE